MAETFEIKRAERKQARLRLALAGSSGGGKTASALRLARGIVEEYLARGLVQGGLEGKVGVIDTERESASLYSHLVPFDTLALNPPYSVDRYIAAMDAMERTGVLVMVVDSISHAWSGEGGVLSILNSIDDRNRFRAFGTEINPVQDRFVDRILRASCHVIVTMRSKTAWVIEQVEKNGRTVNVPKRIGLAPVQRQGIEFEFTTLLDLDSQTHRARAVKNRCPVFVDGKEVLLTEEVGRALAQWMQEGAPAPAEPVGGTPLERAQAVAEAACRACERAGNVPDLVAAFTAGTKAVQAFYGPLDEAALRPLLDAVIKAKDARKAALGGDRGAGPSGAGDNLPPDVVASLEGLLDAEGFKLSALLEYLGVPALRTLERERLQEAVGWIHDQALEFNGRGLSALPVAVAKAGAVLPQPPSGTHAFADMPDDLPWKD